MNPRDSVSTTNEDAGFLMSTLSTKEMQTMLKEMLDAEKAVLPQFPTASPMLLEVVKNECHLIPPDVMDQPAQKPLLIEDTGVLDEKHIAKQV